MSPRAACGRGDRPARGGPAPSDPMQAIDRNRVQPCAYGGCGACACQLVAHRHARGREVERIRCRAWGRGWTRTWLAGEGG